MSFTNNRLSDAMLKTARNVLEGKQTEEEKFDIEIPEEITKEDGNDFVVAASAAKKAGKKTFKFGGKEYPVTIKTDVPTEEKDEEEVTEAKKVKEEDEEGKADNKIEIDPEMETEEKEEVSETGVAGETGTGKLKKMDSPKYEDDVELVDNLPEGMMKKLHTMIDDGMTAEEIAKALKVDVKTIKKLMGEQAKKEGFVPDDFLAIKEAFEEFLELEEGTMAQGIFSRNKAEADAAMDALKDLMRSKLPVGRDGSRNSVEDKIYSIVFDDELFDDFAELRDEKGDNADARPIIRARLKQLRVKV